MKRRKESAFGLHFDFHASPAPGRIIGATLKEEDIREICRSVRPDFIQIDCKGHAGWASYPTELENAMPEFAFDTLELWRRVTKEEGVALFLHYSGVFDMRFCKEHPEQSVLGARDEQGNPVEGITRRTGNYVDALLIPQFKELAGKYGADGVWIDGDCWASFTDFHPETVALFERETGIKLEGRLPEKPQDPYYDEYREFCRELFRRYVRHYVDEVHRDYPEFQIASNWAYSDHMPEPITANVDFISGDLNSENSFNWARYAGRAIAQQEYYWDLMAWNFRYISDNIPKTPVQIMQEAAAVISLGGGFQNYITQYPDGSPRMEQIRRMPAVAEFVRAREPYCFRGKSEHNAAILLSTYDRAHEDSRLWGRSGSERTMGLCSLMCDAGQPVEIACEHTLKKRISAYGLIAVPELKFGVADETKEELLTYVREGGSLLLTGAHTCEIFADSLGAQIAKEGENTASWLNYGCSANGIVKGIRKISAQNAETVAYIGADESKTDLPGAVIINYGKGKVAMVAADIGSQYTARRQFAFRDLIRLIAGKLYDPSVKIEKALGLLEIGILIKEGRRYVQLVNSNGSHSDPNTSTEDFIPPVLDTIVSFTAERRPGALILRPEGKKLDFEYKDGRAFVSLPRIDLHDIIEIVAD